MEVVDWQWGSRHTHTTCCAFLCSSGRIWARFPNPFEEHQFYVADFSMICTVHMPSRSRPVKDPSFHNSLIYMNVLQLTKPASGESFSATPAEDPTLTDNCTFIFIYFLFFIYRSRWHIQRSTANFSSSMRFGWCAEYFLELDEFNRAPLWGLSVFPE